MKRIIAIALMMIMLLGCGALAEGTLNVTGSGTVYVAADRVSASLGISISGEDLAELQNQANERMSAICQALLDAGLEGSNISTNYLYISPRYDYSGEMEKITGYSISNSLTILTDDIDSIGSYIDAAFAAGANTFDSINFTTKDDSEAQRKALELAMDGERIRNLAQNRLHMLRPERAETETIYIQTADSNRRQALQQDEEPKMELLDILLGLLNVLNIGE